MYTYAISQLARSLVLLSLSVFILFLITPHLSSAQETGVSIRPAVVEETLDPGTVKEYVVTIENLNETEQTFYLFTRNISGVRDGGTPVFAENFAERTGFELADWIDLSLGEITLPAQGSERVSYTISVPENASPGSHFGGIFVSVEPPDIQNSGAAVGYQVANIISIRVSGDAIEEASIRQFSTSKFLYGSQNVDFNIRIENSGNVLIRPTGPLEIYNMLGNKVGQLTFNESRFAVFPNDTREYSDVSWVGDSLGFGRYEAILSPVYGDEGAKKTMSSTVTFWIIPLNIIGPVLGVFAVLMLITFIGVRLYIKRSLAHLSQGRRIVRRRKKGGSSAALLFLVVMLTVTALFLIILLALFA